MYFKDKRLSPLQRDYNYFINEFEGKMLSKAEEQCTEYLIKYNKITEQQKSIL